MPVPLSIEQHYRVDPSDYWSAEQLQNRDDYFDAEIQTFLSLWSAVGRPPAALDVGAGIGKCMRSLERHGFTPMGLEPSAAFRAYAIRETGVAADQLIHGAIEDAVFPSDSFDFVTFGAVLEHLYDPAGSLAKALGWARPGALVHVEVPSSAWLMSRLVDVAYRLQGLDYTSHLSPMHPPYHLYEFTPACFERFAAIAGVNLALYRHHVCPTYAPGFIDPLLTRIMGATGTGMQLEVWLRKPVPC